MRELQALSHYPDILRHAGRSRALGKLAASTTGDRATNVLREKMASDARVVDLLEKTAVGLPAVFKTIKVPEALKKGLGYGAGAAVPLGLAGAGLVGMAGNEAEDRMTSMLGKGMAGVAALGVGAYGMHNLGKRMDRSSRTDEGFKRYDTMRNMGRRHSLMDMSSADAMRNHLSKKGSDESVDGLIEKISAAGEVLTAMRKVVSDNPDPSVRKLAEYSVTIANGHITDLIGDLLL